MKGLYLWLFVNLLITYISAKEQELQKQDVHTKILKSVKNTEHLKIVPKTKSLGKTAHIPAIKQHVQKQQAPTVSKSMNNLEKFFPNFMGLGKINYISATEQKLQEQQAVLNSMNNMETFFPLMGLRKFNYISAAEEKLQKQQAALKSMNNMEQFLPNTRDFGKTIFSFSPGCWSSQFGSCEYLECEKCCSGDKGVCKGYYFFGIYQFSYCDCFFY
ncbi:uncharacterized protein LOC126881774 isoform X1 [Diabrotica virgifera virgifera]|uniref:Uncharacterized protein n=1 Tax=Diabrotica virgifera virgifera TaxID=50390 RepID=A0ABM5JW99_DIAVI|nr:uncharacterized protein LOC126881774 isoform X1 [Diabrotica virgifera virgifera]